PIAAYVRPTGYLDNPNYTVTKVNPGLLTVHSAPEVIEARRLAYERQEQINADTAAIYGWAPEDHEGVYVGGTFMNLPPASLQDMAGSLLELALSDNGGELLAMIEAASAERYG